MRNIKWIECDGMDKQSEPGRVKVFFALWPTLAARDQLLAWQAILKDLCGGRAMRGETLHVTLVFVGMVEPTRLELLREAAHEAVVEGFDLCLDTVCYWMHNHIVHAAPKRVAQSLGQLVATLEQGLARRGFDFDRRTYRPHVTLLRNARWTDAPLPVMPRVCWPIKDFALIQSVSGEYQVLARFPLRTSDG